MQDKDSKNLKILEVLQHHGEIMEIIKHCPQCSARFKSKLKIASEVKQE